MALTIFDRTQSSKAGTATNDNAAAGEVGEIMTVSGASVSTPSNGNYGDMGHLDLTAGDWDVTLMAYVNRNTATWTRVDSGISPNSGTSGSGITLPTNMASGEWASTSTNPNSVTQTIAAYRISLASPQTWYAKIRADFTVGQPQYSFRMSARRVR